MDSHNRPIAVSTEIWKDALIPTRSLMFHTVSAFLPFVIITFVLLFTRISGTTLVLVSIACGLIALIGFGRLLYETTLDIAGFKEYTLPVWSVVYLMIEIIGVFAFLIFALHVGRPGQYFGGFGATNGAAFLDALYLSLCNYIVHSPDGTFVLKTQGVRFLAATQSLLCMFLSMITITEFIHSF